MNIVPASILVMRLVATDLATPPRQLEVMLLSVVD